MYIFTWTLYAAVTYWLVLPKTPDIWESLEVWIAQGVGIYFQFYANGLTKYD